jgi:uncharacterized protein
MYHRSLIDNVLKATQYSPILLLNGSRQVGKSTLLEQHLGADRGYKVISLDDPTHLRLAKDDPTAFLAGLPKLVAIDEVQRAPELFLPLKRIVDQEREKRRFVLSGSANMLALPKLADSLAGRMEVFSLWPLAQWEISGKSGSVVDHLFEDKLPEGTNAPAETEIVSRIFRGGYPEALRQMLAGRDNEWFRSYLMTVLQRDVREISDIERLHDMPQLLALLASRVGNLVNQADIARSMRLSAITLGRYLNLLRTVFLVVEIPAWLPNNLGTAITKSPKLCINDTGLLCYLRGQSADQLMSNRSQLGPVLENFVAMELIKHLGWSAGNYRMFHYRTRGNEEIDLILQRSDGKVVAVEVKASTDVGTEDFRWIRRVEERLGDSFHRGVVLYLGKERVRFSEKLVALSAGILT